MTHRRSSKELRAIHAKNGSTAKPASVPAQKQEGHQHKGYRLYSREMDLGDGKRLRAYTYSKHRHKPGWKPADIPPGYRVTEDAAGRPAITPEAPHAQN